MIVFDELQKYFGTKVNCREIESLKGLPLYLTIGRKFYRLEMLNTEFMVVMISADNRFGTAALKKQLTLYADTVKMKVAYSFEEVTYSQRAALIKANIPFLALPGQVYLPFLGVVLQDKLKKQQKLKADKMMPATQSLFLYLFYAKPDGVILKSRAASDLGLTRTSITRASGQLLAMGLISQEKVGKEVHMRCADKGIALYEKAKPFLINPVQKSIFVKNQHYFKTFPKAGETALAKQTMLNEPEHQEIAVYKGMKCVDDLEEISVQWNEDEDIVNVQLWKYDPCLFAQNGCVDPISLLCSLQDDEDERIEMALEELQEKMNW